MTPSDGPPQLSGLSRRAFLKTTAAVGAGLVAAPTVLAAPTPAEEKPLALALVGCGTHGLLLLNQLVKMPAVQIKAVCDIWPHDQAYAVGRLKAYGQTVPAYADFQDLLAAEKGLDAVVIATPDFCHAPQALAAFKAGLHVYCEEPLAPTLKDARDMVLAARAAKRLLQVGYQRRSNPRYLAALEYLTAKKACGQILSASAQWHRLAVPGRGFPKDKALDAATLKKYGYDSMGHFRDWLWYKSLSAGPMLRFGATQIDVLSWLLGSPPRAVQATAVRRASAADQWPDTYFALYEWEVEVGGKPRVILGRHEVLQGSSHRGYFEEVTGTEGCLRVSESRPPAQLIREFEAPYEAWEKALTPTPSVVFAEMMDNASLEPEEDEFYVQPPSWQKPELRDYALPVKEQPYYLPHLENFFAAIRKGAPLACPGEVAYQTLVSALAATQAAESQKRVELKPEDFKV